MSRATLLSEKEARRLSWKMQAAPAGCEEGLGEVGHGVLAAVSGAEAGDVH